jgi:hypothetical protein
MSVVGYRLECDTCEHAWMVANGSTVETARAHARSSGWDRGEQGRSGRSDDRCPRCVATASRRAPAEAAQ